MQDGNRRTFQLPGDEREGIECPDCGCVDLRVYRTSREAKFIVRERICRNCGKRLHTREQVDF